MLNVLLAEDDRDLALAVIDHLEIESIICDYAANGMEGAALIAKNRYDVLILDINMPGMDGLSLCEKIRSDSNDTPILMLTARDTLANKIEGFNAGTDDYMIKPFEIEELIVRLHALSKRRSGQVSVIQTGPLQLNLHSRTASINSSPIKLSPTGFKLLEVLMRASPHPVPHADLIMKVWGDDLPDSNKLRVHIHNLRKALETGNAGDMLKTATGFGFFISSEHS
ncbi:response regulator transcription factor [Aliamphritea hakodatensis]|uniref:response regulator transcription factor n=1 Tax=Aliamphritea hakodatensis TaxID=2895352 RepID=UPI0022FD4984|nr:response regulator transcription factor [Aliamphritea hakodatensis]